jgi:hypothetical protein
MRRLEALPAMNRMQQLALALGLAQFLAEYDLPSSTADTNTSSHRCGPQELPA